MFAKAVAVLVVFALVCVVWVATRSARKAAITLVKRAFGGGSDASPPDEGNPNAS